MLFSLGQYHIKYEENWGDYAIMVHCQYVFEQTKQNIFIA